MKEELRQLREDVLEELPEYSMVILEGSSEQIRNNDVNQPFRQHSSFFYLTHNQQPNCKLIMLKKAGSTQTFLFKKEQDELDKVWNNHYMDFEEEKEHGSFTEVFDIKLFENFINKNLLKYSNLYIDFTNSKHCKLIEKIDKNHSINLNNINGIINKKRLIKRTFEIENMRKAISITNKAFTRLCRNIKEHYNESHIQADIDYIFTYNQVKHSYPSIVASGINGSILHYTDNNKPLGKNELLLMDFGCEYNCYASDISRTIPISGKFSSPQKELYEGILSIQKTIIGIVKEGITFKELNDTYNELIVDFLLKLNIMEGEKETIIEEASFRLHSPHSIGHWLGLDVHDNCPYKDKNDEPLGFKPGMIITIEPGIYLKNDENIPEKYRGISIRIEDDILVTTKGCEVLSKEIPKEIKDIEDLINKKGFFKNLLS